MIKKKFLEKLINFGKTIFRRKRPSQKQEDKNKILVEFNEENINDDFEYNMNNNFQFENIDYSV